MKAAVTLAEQYTIKARFLRSTRLDADLDDKSVFDNFILHETALKALDSVAKQFSDAGQRAFTLTGPYGGGKSTLALLIAALYSPIDSVRISAEKLLNKKELTNLRRLIPLGKKGWVTLRIVGRKAGIIEVFTEALQDGIGEFWPTKKPDAIANIKKIRDDKSLIQFLLALANEAHLHGGGLLILVDEMGKLLEHSAATTKDIHFFQDMAEAFARSKAPCLFTGILHQSFQEYAKDLSTSIREEWSKIQGRFVDIPFAVSVDEVIKLVSTAIEGTKPTTQTLSVAKKVAEALTEGRFSSVTNLADTLAKCWPLHPVTALLLGPLSRRRFSQNERSIFGFLNSVEPFGFKEFLLANAQAQEGYTPYMLWDYLKQNLEPAIVVSPDGHRWAEAVDAIERTAAYKDTLSTNIVKTVALLDLFGRSLSIKPTNQLLCATFSHVPAKKITDALSALANNSIIVFRKHLDSWAIFAGSDIDIDAEVTTIKNRLSNKVASWESISQQLRPIVAKRHYHTTGSLRWFDKKIESIGNIKSLVHHDINPCFVLCIDNGEPSTSKGCKTLSESCGHIIGYSPLAYKLVPHALELLALEEAGRTLGGQLEHDKIARRELSGRVDVAQHALFKFIEQAFYDATWYFKGELLSKEGANLSQIASTVAEIIYPHTPLIKNELINRNKPSSNAVAARRALMYEMVNHAAREKLEIKGSPPELSLYLNLLSASGLHAYDSEIDVWSFGDPKDKSFKRLWEKARELLTASTETTLAFADLFSCWSKPPYGLKEGVLPILALAFILAHEDELALYLEGRYFPTIDDVYIDRLLQDPTTVGIRYFDVKGVKKSVLSKLADFVLDEFSTEKPETALAIAKPLAHFVHGLRPWVKRTKRLTAQTMLIRDTILSANDPYKLLFADLPKICKVELSTEGAEDFIKQLAKAIGELKASYDDLLNEIKHDVFDTLGVDANSKKGLGALKTRCDHVIGVSGDFRLDNFAQRIGTADGGNKWVESIASLATNKPPRDWADTEIDKAKVELHELAKKFLRVESYSRIRAKHSGTMSLAVFIEEGSTVHEYSKSLHLTRKQQPDDRMIQQLRRFVGEIAADKNIQTLIVAELLKELMELHSSSKPRKLESEEAEKRYAHESN